jgi:hypothetical protein
MIGKKRLLGRGDDHEEDDHEAKAIIKKRRLSGKTITAQGSGLVEAEGFPFGGLGVFCVPYG